MKKNIIIAILGTIVVGFLVLLTIGLSAKKEPVVDSFKNEVIAGCLDGGEVSYEYCECGYNYLNENYTKSEILELGLEVQKGNLPQPFYDAAVPCGSFIK